MIRSDNREVLPITTASILDTVPPAFRDRMEVIRLAGHAKEGRTESEAWELIALAFERPGSFVAGCGLSYPCATYGLCHAVATSQVTHGVWVSMRRRLKRVTGGSISFLWPPHYRKVRVATARKFARQAKREGK